MKLNVNLLFFFRRLMNFVLVCVMLFGGFQLSIAGSLDCKFENPSASSEYYTCNVTTFLNSDNDVTISEYSGKHLPEHIGINVGAIFIQDMNARFIPRELGVLSSLYIFAMKRCQLTEISADNFKNMTKLIYIDFSFNELSSLPCNAFNELLNLRKIILDSNKITKLSSDLFATNVYLKYISLQNNNITEIGSGLFEKILNLDLFILTDYCVFKDYKIVTKIGQLELNFAKCQSNQEKVTENTLSSTTLSPPSDKDGNGTTVIIAVTKPTPSNVGETKKIVTASSALVTESTPKIEMQPKNKSQTSSGLNQAVPATLTSTVIVLVLVLILSQ